VKSWAFRCPNPRSTGTENDPSVERDLVRFGYTKDELKDVVTAIASGNGEPVTSMGDDAAQAFLERRMPVAAYLRQKFAQVTNPPIDSVREGFVFDMRAWVGSGDTNGDVPAIGSIVMLETAVLDETAFDDLRFDARLVQHRMPLELGDEKLATRASPRCATMRRTPCATARPISCSTIAASRVPIPAILAAGAIHQRLIAAVCACRRRSPSPTASRATRTRSPPSIAVGANVVTPWLSLRYAERHGTRNAFSTPCARPDQDHGEARHLHAAFVHRRADVRVARSRPRHRRCVLPRDARARAGRRLRATRRRSARVEHGGGERRRAARSRLCSAIAATASSTPSIRACSRRCAPPR
jgi:hypothetical protein